MATHICKRCKTNVEVESVYDSLSGKHCNICSKCGVFAGWKEDMEKEKYPGRSGRIDKTTVL